MCGTTGTGDLGCVLVDDGQYVAIVYGEGSNYFFGSLSAAIRSNAEALGHVDGTVIAVLMAGTLALIFAFAGPAGAIIGFLLGLTASAALGLRLFDFGVFIGISIILFFTMWRLKK